jgi:hypothetical protein
VTRLGPGWLAAFALIAPACFHPSYGDRIPCDPEVQCATGVCGADGFCPSELAGPGGDASLDDTMLAPLVDAPPQVALCLGTFVNVCIDPPPAAAVTLDADFDTGSSPLCATTAALTPAVDACVIAGRSIVVPAGVIVHVTGARKLILIAGQTVQIAGTLDTAGHATTAGPAADVGPCMTDGSAPTTTGMTGGGGYGGSFGRRGGSGGPTKDGASGGISPSLITPTELRGGCAGIAGGMGAAAGSAGAGGHSGGAVLAVAGTSITITGALDASGAGGTGGHSGRGGAGGGGSGGMIVLESPTITIANGGACFANGGGGGAGAGAGNEAGTSGGESSGPSSQAPGGTGVGGTGGAGDVGVSSAGLGGESTSSAGGGGGGGGVGVIKLISPSITGSGLAKVSPPAT